MVAMAGLYATSEHESPAPLVLGGENPAIDKFGAIPAIKKRGGRPKKVLTPAEEAKKAAKAKRDANKIHTEAYHQTLVVVDCDRKGYPFFAVPNGARRTMWEIIQAKRGGVKAGVYDLVFPVARRGYHGFFLEMKRPDRTKAVVSPAQKEWGRIFKREGYLAEIAYGYDEAIKLIDDYFEGWIPDNEHVEVL